MSGTFSRRSNWGVGALSLAIGSFVMFGNIGGATPAALASTTGTAVSSKVASSTDDAEEYTGNGTMYLDSSDVELTYDPGDWAAPGQQVVGLRFASLAIPKGATVTSAHVEFTVKETNWTEATSLKLAAEAADNSKTYTTTAHNISSRSKTGASVAWNNLPVWTTAGAVVQTPDMSPVVQEVVNRSGWTSGNALSIVVSGTGHRTAWAYDGNAAAAPKLVVTYTTPSVSPTATPTSTVAPTVSSTATPTPSASSPSGQAMPVGDLPGWHQVFTEDFKTNAPLGSFASVYGSKWSLYLDGWKDTSGNNYGTNSGYYPSKVLSVSNGVLNEYLHVENGTHMAAALEPILPGKTSGAQGQLYGKYTVRFKADSLNDFKTAWLLWPDSEVWPRDGEIDFPEGRLNSTISAFMHRQGATSGSDQDAFNTSTTYTGWHTASTEWSPTATNFILDGKIIGTSTSRIPNTPMHYVLQTESCLGCTYNNVGGNLQIDWVAVYSRA